VAGCRTEPNNCVAGQCDGTTHRCRCASDDECEQDEFCSGQGVCESGCRTAPDNCAQGVCDAELRICAAPRCVRDADCGAGQSCTVIQAGGGLQLRCVQALAQGREGAECARGGECASRLCVNDAYCFSACVDGADCDSGRCSDVTVNFLGVNGGPFVFQTCSPPPETCASDAMCPAAQQCLPVGESPLAPDRIQLGCVNDRPGDAGGAPCADDPSCSSGNCLNQGVCWAPCRPDLGAGDCAAGQRCYRNQIYFQFDQGTPRTDDDTYDGLSACLPDVGSGQACQNTRCGAGEFCALAANQSRTGWDPQCRRAVGNGLGGGLRAAGVGGAGVGGAGVGGAGVGGAGVGGFGGFGGPIGGFCGPPFGGFGGFGACDPFGGFGGGGFGCGFPLMPVPFCGPPCFGGFDCNRGCGDCNRGRGDCNRGCDRGNDRGCDRGNDRGCGRGGCDDEDHHD